MSVSPSSDLVEGSAFVFKSWVYLRCIQCLVDMTLDAPKINATFGGKSGTHEVCLSFILAHAPGSGTLGRYRLEKQKRS